MMIETFQAGGSACNLAGMGVMAGAVITLMCGRYELSTTKDEIKDYFKIIKDLTDKLVNRYNVSPSQQVPAVFVDEFGQRELRMVRWGWNMPATHYRKKNTAAFNARDDNLMRTDFGKALKAGQRCISVASGFYEYDKSETPPQPFYFRPDPKRIFAFPAVYQVGLDPKTGEESLQISTITTSPNEIVAPVHARMPVILQSQQEEDFWLTAAPDELEQLRKLLRPYPEEGFIGHKVSKAVNKSGTEDPSFIFPLNSA